MFSRKNKTTSPLPSPKISKKEKKGKKDFTPLEIQANNFPTAPTFYTHSPEALIANNDLSISRKIEEGKEKSRIFDAGLEQYKEAVKNAPLSRSTSKENTEVENDQASVQESNLAIEYEKQIAHYKDLAEKAQGGMEAINNQYKAQLGLSESLLSEKKNLEEKVGRKRSKKVNMQKQHQEDIAQHISEKENLQLQNKELGDKYKKQSILIPQLKQEKEDLVVKNTENFQSIQRRDQVLLTNKEALSTANTSTYVALAVSVASAVLGGLVQIPFIKSFIQQYPIVNVIFSILGVGGAAAATTVGGVKLATYSKNKEAKQAYDSLQTDIAEQGQEQGAALAA